MIRHVRRRSTDLPTHLLIRDQASSQTGGARFRGSSTCRLEPFSSLNREKWVTGSVGPRRKRSLFRDPLSRQPPLARERAHQPERPGMKTPTTRSSAPDAQERVEKVALHNGHHLKYIWMALAAGD